MRSIDGIPGADNAYDFSQPMTITCARCHEETLFEGSETSEDGGPGRWCEECLKFYRAEVKKERES